MKLIECHNSIDSIACLETHCPFFGDFCQEQGGTPIDRDQARPAKAAADGRLFCSLRKTSFLDEYIYNIILYNTEYDKVGM
jgi:hypothetical protein